MEKMHCPNCGEIVEVNFRGNECTCGFCGKRFGYFMVRGIPQAICSKKLNPAAPIRSEKEKEELRKYWEEKDHEYLNKRKKSLISRLFSSFH